MSFPILKLEKSVEKKVEESDQMAKKSDLSNSEALTTSATSSIITMECITFTPFLCQKVTRGNCNGGEDDKSHNRRENLCQIGSEGDI